MNQPNPTYGFERCSADDPKRSDCWCPHYNKWTNDFSGIEGCVSNNCGQFWRKPVEIPAGWELVPDGDEVISGDALLYKDSHIEAGKHWHGYRAKRCGAILAFIRRKSQPVSAVESGAEVGRWFLCSERLPDKPQRVVAVNHSDRKPHCTTWDGSEFTLNPKPYAWCPIDVAPAIPKTAAELAWEEYASPREFSYEHRICSKAAFLAGYAKGAAK